MTATPESSGAPRQLGQQLYDSETERFTRILETNRQEAYRRFGMCLLYSLSDLDVVLERNRLGYEPRDMLDFYNQGCLESARGNHREALQHYRKAMSMGSDLPDLYYNLALTYQQLGEAREARKNFQRYLSIMEEDPDRWDSEDRADVEEVRQILAEDA